jgi:DNA-binding Xre family transcriptional regulator
MSIVPANYDHLIGKKYGMLTLTTVFPHVSQMDRRCEAICECGITREYSLRCLLRGQTRSCGCIGRGTGKNHTKYEAKELFLSKSAALTKRIRALMKEKGINQADLARKMNKTETEVSRFLSGKYNFTLRTLAKIQCALGADVLFIES